MFHMGLPGIAVRSSLPTITWAASPRVPRIGSVGAQSTERWGPGWCHLTCDLRQRRILRTLISEPGHCTGKRHLIRRTRAQAIQACQRDRQIPLPPPSEPDLMWPHRHRQSGLGGTGQCWGCPSSMPLGCIEAPGRLPLAASPHVVLYLGLLICGVPKPVSLQAP